MEDIVALLPWIFASITLVGVGYLLISLFFGSIAEADLGGDLDLDMDLELDVDAGGADLAGETSGEAVGLSCNVIAAFMAGFGSIGLTGALAGWDPLLILLVSLLVGVLFSQVVIRILRFVLRQQSNNLLTKNRLIGVTARVTVNTPAGQFGEALVEEYERMKYPVRNLEDDVLAKGDIVEIIDVREGRLYVRKADS